jgi:trigger factor
MNLDLKSEAKSKVRLSITLSHAEFLKYIDSAFEKVGATLKIDGFRSGKAPKKIIEETAGQARLVQESIDLALAESYPEALKTKNLYPVNQPKITIDSFPTLISGDLKYTVEFDNLPEVKLRDYSKISVKKPAIKKATDKDVEKVIEYLKKQKATFSEVDRAAKKGDRAEINFSGTVKGVKKEGMESRNHPIVIGEGVMIPGFEEELIGLKKADKKKFKIRFPKEYHAKDLAGEEAEFEIELIDLKEVVLPKIDLEFAKTFGHTDVSAMKIAIKKSLDLEMEEKATRDLEMVVIDKVLKNLSVEIPESLVEQEIDRMTDQLRKQIEAQGLNFERYLQSIKKDLADFRKDSRNQAEKNVQIGFLIGEIIKDRKLDPKDDQAGRKAIDYLISVIVK